LKVHPSHPAIRRQEVSRLRAVFDCATCHGTLLIRNATVQPDGSLQCVDCCPESHQLRWCPGCQSAKTTDEFVKGQRCQDCSTPKPKTCHQCGNSFTPKRRDGRFCSTTCRVTANRKQHQEENNA